MQGTGIVARIHERGFGWIEPHNAPPLTVRIPDAWQQTADESALIIPGRFCFVRADCSSVTRLREIQLMRIEKLIDRFLAWCSRHRAPATCGFYRTRLRMFRLKHGRRKIATLSPLEIDKFLSLADAGMSDSTKHHNAVALERLQKFALDNKLLDRPVFGILEKPRVGCRERLPTPAETEAIMSRASPAFRLIYSALR